ncbi:MAG TPA: ATP-binding protein, partial [Stellaceae bacterium]|nr:ATP-binding protein [Stellaceae bacterium]
VRMPELDGFELAAMIRAHPRFQSTAIIFVSAEALTDLDRLKGYSYGAVDYLPVPIIPELLRAKVRVFAELYRTTRQLKRLNSELEARVAERTAELHAANAELEARVEARTREREMALAQLHEAQKLESLGQLTGGLAHDFNNLLMAIMGSLDQLERRLHHDEGVSGLIEGALKSAERGAALTKRMLAFARRQELKPKPVEVCRLIKGMEEMLARTLGPSTRITMAFEEGLAPVQIDPNQLELALLNLALNARDAMPDGGSLTIEAGTVTIEAGTADLAPGHYISIRVTDTGIGMDELVLKRAAEPFFTTKAVGKGTGLGLSMVHGLAAQSGGCMRISSGTGRGTTIALYLPVAGSGAASGRAKAAPSLSPQAIRPLVVLVVDDDHLVAASTRGMLESLG